MTNKTKVIEVSEEFLGDIEKVNENIDTFIGFFYNSETSRLEAKYVDHEGLSQVVSFLIQDKD